AEIMPTRIEHRMTIEPRVDRLPRAKGAVPAKAGIVEAINGLVAALAPRPRPDPVPRPAPAPAVRPQPLSPFPPGSRPAHPSDRPAPAAQPPQTIDAMPLGLRCRWPHTDAP